MRYKQEMIKLLTIKSYEEKNKIIAKELEKLWNMIKKDAPKQEILKVVDFLEEFIVPINIIV